MSLGARGFRQPTFTAKGRVTVLNPAQRSSVPSNGGKGGLGYCGSNKPFYFSAAVPEGNYRVTVTLGNKTDASVTTVKAELRRLMVEKVETQKGKFATESFIVNVRTPNIPGGGEVKLKDRERTTEWLAWDEKLTLEFNNSHPIVDSIDIERVDVPTIFLLGDSTVCDQPLEPYASWGQMLTKIFQRRCRDRKSCRVRRIASQLARSEASR